MISATRIETVDGQGRVVFVGDGARGIEALVAGRVVDDLGSPLGAGLGLTVSTPRLVPWTGEGGRFGLAGAPALVWDDLTVAHTVEVSFTAPGYRPLAVAIVIPANPVFPVAAAALALRRLPLRLQGHTSNRNTRAPITAATIDLDPGAAAPHPVLLRTPLALSREVAATVQGMALTAVALGGPVGAVDEAPASSTRLAVGDTTGIAIGQVLQIGPAERALLAEVAAVSADPARPAPAGIVALVAPLEATVRAGDAVLAFTAAPSGAATALQRDADAGEAVLALAAVPAGDAVRIGDALQPDEWHALGALGDADGRWQANGVGYPAVVRLRAAATGFTAPPTLAWPLDFANPVNVIDFEFTP